jgi:hypothetical protein
MPVTGQRYHGPVFGIFIKAGIFRNNHQTPCNCSLCANGILRMGSLNLRPLPAYSPIDRP